MVPKNSLSSNFSHEMTVCFGAEQYLKKLNYTIVIDDIEIFSGRVKINKRLDPNEFVWATEKLSFVTVASEISQIIIKQENMPGELELENIGGLVLSWIEINGKRIKGNSPWVTASKGWKAWFDGSGRVRETWRGNLSINLNEAIQGRIQSESDLNDKLIDIISLIYLTNKLT